MELDDIEKLVGLTGRFSLKTTEDMVWGKGEDVEEMHILSPSSIVELVHICSYRMLKDKLKYGEIPVILDTNVRFVSPTFVGVITTVDMKVENVNKNIISVSFKVFDEFEEIAEGNMKNAVVSKGYLKRRIDEKTSQFA